MVTRKNPAAVALGRRGGSANSRAQQAVRRAPKPGAGRPREPLPCRRCGKPTLERNASRRPDCGCEGTQAELAEAKAKIAERG